VIDVIGEELDKDNLCLISQYTELGGRISVETKPGQGSRFCTYSVDARRHSLLASGGLAHSLGGPVDSGRVLFYLFGAG